jgi:hypothetical protein
MNSSLTLRYEADPCGDEGQLWLAVETPRFFGSGYFWADRQDLAVLAKELVSFPLTKPISWTWGYNALNGDDLILSIDIRPEGLRGHLVAHVNIADLLDPKVRLSARFNTTYSALSEFHRDLVAVAENKSEEAVLSESH